MVKREQKSKEAKNAIISAAITLFTKKGYKQTTIRDLCKESGYSVGAFYHHFQSKSNILEQMYNEFDNDTKKKITSISPKNCREGVLLIVIEHFKRVQYFGVGSYAQYLGEALITHNNDLTTTRIFEMNAIKQHLEKGVTQSEFSKRLDPEIVASIITCTIACHVDQWCRLRGHYKLVDKGISDVEYLLDQF